MKPVTLCLLLLMIATAPAILFTACAPATGVSYGVSVHSGPHWRYRHHHGYYRHHRPSYRIHYRGHYGGHRHGGRHRRK